MKPKTLISLAVLAAAMLSGCGKDEAVESPSPSTRLQEELAQQDASTGPASEESPPLPSPDAQPVQEEPFDDKRKRFWTEIARLIENPEVGLTMKEWKIAKERHWRPEYDEVIWEESDTESIFESLAIPEGRDPLIVQVLGGDFTHTEDPAEQDSLISLHFLTMCAVLSREGVSIPEVLEERSDDSNITRGDVMLFEFLSDAYVEGTKRKASQAEREQWKRLATAKNSLHRLLALKHFIEVEPSRAHRLELYQNYLEERDPGILKEVLNQVYRTSLPESADLLSRIQTREDLAANPDLLAEISYRIEDLRKLPPSEE